MTDRKNVIHKMTFGWVLKYNHSSITFRWLLDGILMTLTFVREYYVVKNLEANIIQDSVSQGFTITSYSCNISQKVTAFIDIGFHVRFAKCFLHE